MIGLRGTLGSLLLATAALIHGQANLALKSPRTPHTSTPQEQNIVEHPPSERPALGATFTILRQTYCHVDDDSFAVTLNVRLHFTNISDGAVILSKRIDNTDLVRVAINAQAAEDGRFEYASNPDRFVSANPRNPPTGDSPAKAYFIVLAPQQSYEAAILTHVFGTKGPTSEHGLITRGSHVLQLGISTWPYTGYTDVQGLREKWANFGYLEAGSVYTNFVPFRIPEKFGNPRCD